MERSDNKPKQPASQEPIREGELTELMKAHLDDVTGGISAGHNSWKQSY